jgi:predicted negative regulator of RcsB-dependent stress response
MSQPSSSPAPQADEHGFDPLAFWIQYKGAIKATSALILTAMVVYAVTEWSTYQKRQAAAEAFAVAKKPEELSKFIHDYQGMPLAGNASLLLAGKQREEGKVDEAVKTLNTFIADYAKHPMAGAAHLALASILEQQGKQDEALAAYRRITATDPRGMAAPVALLRAARIFRLQNKNDEAKGMYESLQSQFPKSSFANEALLEGQQLTGSAEAANLVPSAPVEPAPSAPQGTK